MSIGILAYGSLITDPDYEIRASTRSVIENVQTPFCVEYARKSSSRNGAPTLVSVSEEGIGSPVKGSILVLDPTITEQQALNMLYRREIHMVGTNKVYDPHSQGDVHIAAVEDFMGLQKVIYTAIKPNFDEILNPSLSPHQKAALLADAAICSLCPDTFSECTDGIVYLHNNIKNGIITPLTDLYREEILRRANTHDLMKARAFFASQKGLLPPHVSSEDCK